MINNKGFTLIELIATIAIMLAIVVIAIPTSINFIEKGKQNEYELIRDKILVATEKYYYDNNISTNIINITDIINYIDIDEKYIINNKIIDPRSDSKNQRCLNGNIIISYNTNSHDKATFKYSENASISCN